MSIKLIASSLVASFLLLGCGGGGDDSTTAITTIDGQLVDNYVENTTYSCNDGTVGNTDRNGRFSCKSLPVSFSLGGLRLGSVDTLQSDKQVFPQDLLKVARTDTNNTDVLAMARFLQSCDSDKNLSTGINISDETKTKLDIYDEDFNATNIDNYAQDTNVTLVDEESSQEHLENTVNFVDAVNAVTSLPQNVKDELLTAESVLTQELKDTLSYMQNEERLAYDVYNELYKLFPTANQLNNIATNSESAHIQTVELLILKYINSVDEFSNLDLNTDLSETTAGEYSISAIRDLYDALMAIGDDSKQAALEVGCMIEVTDINDLNDDIALAQASNATDVEAAFVYLRNGSYNHYWAFDSGLKNMGVTEGCCSLGTVNGVDYCQNYPK
ncbi:MAG: DUF2202 domain-containing protein [Sulfurimonas sp.]|jgi:hypothetical protein|nr:DUF2202 domain-containing protein [Sulfurimonas sp.]MBU1217237.1 DUF2202 domain-containing protein [bacterium]MBU1434023.1 DUF2202 domain-containing protein [bacterium]MBU1503005.1 DUF2202 domain-containing protein [bacterium]MBU3939772.1 DUF2202 domain-containing protein [bacterium]